MTALSVGTLLYVLGLALGLSAIDPADPSSFRASSIFTGIWSLVTSVVALFVGGMVASRVAGTITRTGGAIHGLVMWSLTTVAGAFLLFNLLTQAISGAAMIGKTTVQAGASAAGHAGGIANALGVDYDDVLAPINRRLQSEGKPPVTAAQVEAASKDIVQSALREGRLDRGMLETSIAQTSNLSQRDAQEIAAQVETAFSATGSRVSDAASSLQTKALRAAESTGAAFWGVFGAMLVGMLAAVLGAALGATDRQRMRPWRGTPYERPYETHAYDDRFSAGHSRV